MALASLYEVGVHAYSRDVRLLLILLSLSTHLVWASECEDILAKAGTDRAGRNFYFNRWNLPDGMNAETVMDAAVQKVTVELHRPLLIFDTNPDAKTWGEFNIVRPKDDDLFPGQTYRQLSDAQKSRLFAGFYMRSIVRLRYGEVPVLIFDHHFESKILSDASTTPLVVDFLNWLNQLPHTENREYLRRVIETGVRLRDHSDPDILLANVAAAWVGETTSLKMFGEQIKRIAYYNDHADLEPGLSSLDRREVLLGYYLTVGFEKMIGGEKGGFEKAVHLLELGLERVAHVAHDASFRSDDGVPELIEDLKRFKDFDSTVKAMEEQMAERELFQLQMKAIYSTKGAIARDGETVVVRFPPTPVVPSGLEVMQYLKVNPLAQAVGAKYVAVVGRETHADGEYWHVKFRVFDDHSSIDRLIQAIRETGMGGGGRSTAGGLYAPAGKRAGDLTELERDLGWALSYLR